MYCFWVALGLLRCALAFSSCSEQGLEALLRCTGFSLRWLLLWWKTGSRKVDFSSCGSWALELGLSSCGTRALAGVRHVGSFTVGIEPVSPTLAGGFLCTVPPRKSA